MKKILLLITLCLLLMGCNNQEDKKVEKIIKNTLNNEDEKINYKKVISFKKNNKLEKKEDINNIKIKVKEGDSILSLLSNKKLNTQFYYNLSNKNKKLLSDIKIGEEINISANNKGEIQSLNKKISLLESIILTNTDGKINIKHEKASPTQQTKKISFNINNSLYADGKKAGLSDYTIMNIIEIMGEKIDFVYSVRKGDKFSIIVDKPMYKGYLAGTPVIKAILFNSKINGKIYAIRFENKENDIGYYDQNGESLKTGFLRTPIDIVRISSGFSNSRKHPITGYTRAHKGTDFAAPEGTPIKAASDGQVIKSTYGSGYGNVVYIKHRNNITTRYAHMSKKLVKPGEYVKQGNIIGLVGSTGRSTGPHLHYEFRIRGKAVNAMKVKLPKSDSISKRNKEEFEAIYSKIFNKLL